MRSSSAFLPGSGSEEATSRACPAHLSTYRHAASYEISTARRKSPLSASVSD